MVSHSLRVSEGSASVPQPGWEDTGVENARPLLGRMVRDIIRGHDDGPQASE